MKYFLSVAFIIGGYSLLFYRKEICQTAIRRWYKAYPNVKIWEPGYSIVILFGGIAFMLFGILTLLGITVR